MSTETDGARSRGRVVAQLLGASRVLGYTLLFYLALSLVLNPERPLAAGQVQFLYGLF